MKRLLSVLATIGNATIVISVFFGIIIPVISLFNFEVQNIFWWYVRSIIAMSILMGLGYFKDIVKWEL